jgi:putative transposase
VRLVNLDVVEMGSLSRFSPTAVLSAFCAFLAASLRSRAALQIEILVLRHQLNVLQRFVKCPRLSAVDLWLWVRVSRNWPSWRAALKILKPATVIGWHHKNPLCLPCDSA